ncbi:hypothetical protein PaecuDRAFT_4257 [Paenibacillus curdlanolyticus YK9]|uniref:Uncharacterized protein n=2 Tax=Paenibacillus curdlanolyticus TaxID=59840 RepID=E0IF16_9BACL|nr:hypothetical protein PaecuDRAFT_4257 [Paenibacillus curdlanolyticus YK9]
MSEWTPSKENIEQFENGFRDYLVSQLKDAGELDETSNNEAKRITYVLDHFNEYKRQYVGIIESGKKVVYCNLIRGSAGDWKNELVVMFDGGPNYFSIHFNVQKERYFDLMINGYA